jgi:imidazolonepropionase-like amidohydrolase
MHVRWFAGAAFVAGTVMAPAAALADTVYTGVTILDPEAERRLPDRYIVVRDKRIVSIGQGRVPRRFRDAERVDMTGRFALAGLIDTHAHMTVGPLAAKRVEGKVDISMEGNAAMTRHDALMMLAFGVTTLRDPGGDTARMIAYRDGVAAGQITGPEARVAGGVIDRPLFAVRGLVDPVTDAEPVAAVVRRQAAAGVDYIKLYQGLSAAELQEGIAAAHGLGLPTIAHLAGVSWTTAADLGIDSLVHAMPVSPDLLRGERRSAFLATQKPGSLDFYRWYEEVDLDGPEVRAMIAALARRKIPVDATLIVFRQAFWGDDRAVRDADLAFANAPLAKNWTTAFSFDAGWTAEDYRRAKAVWPKVLRLVRMLHEAGVPLTIGTDMNNPFVSPGASMVREMALHVEAGIPAWEVLRMATINGARLLKLDDRTGRLKPGKEADIVFLEADPSRDIRAVGKVAGVVANGQFHDPAQLIMQARE